MAPGTSFNKGVSDGLYPASDTLSALERARLGLTIRLPAARLSVQASSDCSAAATDDYLDVRWEPGLADGPSSARFRVVDGDRDSAQGEDEVPRWDAVRRCFCNASGTRLGFDQRQTAAFRLVSVWGQLQWLLERFEGGEGLGRPAEFARAANRLMVVLHADTRNAARWEAFGSCLHLHHVVGRQASADGGSRDRSNPALDLLTQAFTDVLVQGIRPLWPLGIHPQTMAIRLSLSDFAIMSSVLERRDMKEALLADCRQENNPDICRQDLVRKWKSLIGDHESLRRSVSDQMLPDSGADATPEVLARVLSGTLFDMLCLLLVHYRQRERRAGMDATRALDRACRRLWRLLVQSLDLLPPVDADFEDLARALLKGDAMADPRDVHRLRPQLLILMRQRGLLEVRDEDLADAIHLRPATLDLNIHHEPLYIVRSDLHAYRFVNDNRTVLGIPMNCELEFVRVQECEKQGRPGSRLPTQIVVQYMWREPLKLQGADYGACDRRVVSLLCGATLVLDRAGRLLHWSPKAGRGAVGLPLGSRLSGQQRAEQLRQIIRQTVRNGRLHDPDSRIDATGPLQHCLMMEAGLAPEIRLRWFCPCPQT